MHISSHNRREAKHLFRYCLVDGLVDENRVRRVVQQVVTVGHRNRGVVLAHFLRLLRLDCAQHTATVESATTLPAELQTATKAGLTRHYGPGLTTNFIERPSLIGGMRIQVGSDVYDGTILAGLSALEKSF
jgi:F-type H+-transporting ATPase subunit delta